VIDQSNFYLVHSVVPNDDATDFTRRLLGKFVIHGDQLEVLSDYHHMLGELLPDGKITTSLSKRIDQLFHSSYLQVRQKVDDSRDPQAAAEKLGISESRNGGRPLPDGAAVVDSKAISKPPAVFDYQRAGMDHPHTVEINAGKVLLDGNLLNDEEAQTLISNVQSGAATLRYKQRPTLTPIMKMELSLMKSDLGMSMDALKQLVASGHLPQEHYDNVRRELYQDEMVPSIGNKRAYREHAATAQGGVHIMLDANDFKSINDDLSHEHGDNAIKAMGGAMRSAIDKTVGPENAKIHRFGGDEFHVHVPTHEHAALFLRTLRQHLEAIPPIGGTHQLSMSAGIGPDHASADAALNHGAKGQKKAAVAALGGDPNARAGKVRAPHALYAHSVVKGYEGPVPTAPDQMQIGPPPVPKTTPLHAPTAPASPTIAPPSPK
jgi:diguanylate cyclase (GGDEF)-like protein